MAKLKVIQIQLPGRWTDGWLYKEHLILWTRDGQMLVIAISDLAHKVRRQTSAELSVAAEYMIFRNDWKSSEQFRRLNSVPGFMELFDKDFAETDTVTIPIDSFSPDPIETDPAPGFILDTSLYANRLYVGSTEGFFESRFNPDRPKEANPLVQRLDYPVTAINAKYSAINASADARGLLFSRVNFGDEDWWRHEQPFQRTADMSHDNSFASFHLLNYVGKAFPTFLRAETVRRRPHDRAEFQESQIIGYKAQTDIRDVTAAAIERSRKVSLSETQEPHDLRDDAASAEVLGNSAYRLLIRWQETLQVVDISAYQGKDIEARPSKQYRSSRGLETLPSQVLKTYAIGAGFLVELENEIRLITPRGAYLLIRERAARIRTFVHARRHQDTALIIGEECVSLVGFFE